MEVRLYICHLPKVHRRISCYIAQHIRCSYRCTHPVGHPVSAQIRPVGHSVRQTHPVGHSVLETHPAGNVAGQIHRAVHFVGQIHYAGHPVRMDHKPLDDLSLLSWARMVCHLVERHEEASLFAVWQPENRCKVKGVS